VTIKYDPQKVTDWLTPLEKVYARQSAQLDRYYQQLRERDRQEREATIDLPEVFGKLAQFSQTIGQVVAARRTNQDAEFTRRLQNATPEQLQKLNDAFRAGDLKNLKEDHNPYIKVVGKSSDLLLGKRLKDLTSREEILTKKFLLNANSKRLGLPVYLEELEGQPDLKATYKNSSEEKKSSLHLEWVKAKNSHLKLSDGLFASSQALEMQRLVGTSTTNARSKAKVQQLSTDQLKFKERTTLFFDNPDPYDGVLFINQEITDRAAFLKDIPGGKTAIQQATEAVVGDIYDLGQAGQFSIDKLNKLFTGELKDHPAAKNIPDAFFDKEGVYYNHLTQGILEGETVKLNKIKAEGKLQAIQLLNKGYEGGFTSQAEFDAAALPLKSIVDSETWKELEKFNFVSQSETVYNREAEHFNNSVSNGTFLTKSNIERVKNSENNGIKTEFGEKQKAIIQHQKDNQFPTFEQRIPINDATVAEDSGRLTLKEGEVLGPNTWPGKLSLEMTKWEDIYYQKFLKEFPNDADIPTRVNNAMDALKKSKGFGIPIGEVGAGEWSKDDKGRYPNFVRAKIGKITVKDNVDTWDRDFTAQWMWSKYNDTPQTNRVDIFLSTPNSIVTPAANVDMIVSGNLTPEFIYKIGKIPGLTEGEALIQMTEGLINSKVPEHKQLVELYDLKNKLKDLTTPSTDGKEETPLARKIKAEQYLTDLVDKIGDPDISAIHKIGFANATPKQQKRYYDRLQMIADMTNDENEMNAYPVIQ